MSGSGVIVIPRESVEFLAITLTVDGVAVTSPVGVEFALTDATDKADRPTDDWVDAVELGDRIGIMLDGTLDPGLYRVWGKRDSYPEVPVVECATLLRVT